MFKIFDPYPLPWAVFTTIRRQIWSNFDPSSPKKCRRLKWMQYLISRYHTRFFQQLPHQMAVQLNEK